MTAPSRERLRVLFLSSIFPNPQNPTLGTFHEQLAGQLAGMCELEIASPLPWFPRLPGPVPSRWAQYAAIPADYEVAGLRVRSPKYPMVPLVSESIRPALMVPGMLRQIRRLHRQKAFDVIAGLWMYPDGVAAAAVARLLNIPSVLVGLGCDINLCMDNQLQRAQILAAARSAAAIIVVDESLKTRLVADGADGSRITTITNGVDLARFVPIEARLARRRLDLQGDHQRIVYVGRLSPEKGLPTLLRAMATLAHSRPAVTLHVVGDGACRQEYEQLARDVGAGESVRFEGVASHADVPLWIGAADVLCLPSLREGCPNIVLEALACGRPVVASRVGGVPAMLSAETGAVVDAEDVQGFAAALESVLSRVWDPSAVRTAVSTRSWTAVARQYLEIFSGVARAGAEPRRVLAEGPSARLLAGQPADLSDKRSATGRL